MRNKKAIILLFITTIVSGLAQGISMIAIPWYFVEIVERPNVFATAYIIITFLTLFWGLYAGTLIDRYSRKTIFILINLFCGIFIGLISLYGYYNEFLSDFFVIFVFFITIFNYNIHYPNLYAFGQEITEKKYYGKLNSYIEVQGQVTSVFAGAFAAILLTGVSDNNLSIGGINIHIPFNIEAWKIYEIFLMDAFTYLIVLFLLSFISYTSIENQQKDIDNLIVRFKQGLSYLKNNPAIFVFGLGSYILFAFTLTELHVILPSYVHNFLNMGGNVYASAEIYYSFGALFSGFLILRLFKYFNTLFSVIILMILVSLAFCSMTVYNILWVFFLGNFILGITNAGIRILRTTYLFNYVPNYLIGRVSSVFGAFNVIIRLCLISIISLQFFEFEDNIRFGYLLGAVIMFVTCIFLIIWYKRIVLLEKKD